MIDSPSSAPVELARTPKRRRAEELSLVLEAMDIPHLVSRGQAEFVLYTDPSLAPRARAELEAYLRERPLRWKLERLPEHWGQALAGSLVFSLLLTLSNLLANERVFGRDWYARGEAHAEAIREGQWWRTLSALGLHADLAHLSSNLIFGSLFAFLLCQAKGLGAGLFTTLAAGALGNALNACLQAPDHRSIGASTAVFGALGAVVATELARRRRSNRELLWRLAPVLAGALLLGLLGVGGERTDVGAHVAGFCSGALLGLLLLPLQGGWRERGWLQALLLLLTLGSFAGAWLVALR